MFKVGDLVTVGKSARRGVIASKGFTKMIVTPDDMACNAAGYDCASFGTAYHVVFPETGSKETHFIEDIDQV